MFQFPSFFKWLITYSFFSFPMTFRIPYKLNLAFSCLYSNPVKNEERPHTKKQYYMGINNSQLTTQPDYPCTMSTTSSRIGSDTGL